MNTDKAKDSLKEESVEAFVSPLYPESELTAKILDSAFAVHNALGAGFLEKVYENALALELRQRGVSCLQQEAVKVKYRGTIVGDYQTDLLVESRVLVELKACAAIDANHQAQLMNYLRASGIKVGLLINFGRPKLEYRRFVA